MRQDRVAGTAFVRTTVAGEQQTTSCRGASQGVRVATTVLSPHGVRTSDGHRVIVECARLADEQIIDAVHFVCANPGSRHQFGKPSAVRNYSRGAACRVVTT